MSSKTSKKASGNAKLGASKIAERKGVTTRSSQLSQNKKVI